MRPSASRLADTAAHHEQIDNPAVVHVGVIPVVHRRTDDDHRLAMCLVGVIGKLARYGDHVICFDSGNGFLPLRCIGNVILERRGNVGTAQTAIETIVGTQQVEHRGHHCLALGELQLFHRNIADQYVGTHVTVLELLADYAAKVRKSDRRRLISRLDKG